MNTVELKIPGKSHLSPMPPTMLAHAKRAYSTRNVPVAAMSHLLTGQLRPSPGDLVLARVNRIRQHARLELVNGRRARLFVDDLIVVAYGHRYAPDQFESLVPEDLGACHLVAGGGVASQMRYRSPKVKPPTEITPVGLLADADGIRLNVGQWCKSGIRLQSGNHIDVPVFLVVGSSMNAGKTTTAARLIKGLSADGYQVGASKVTGTGSGGDVWHFIDAGAIDAVDFTDAGHVSTYRTSARVCHDIHLALGDFLSRKGADVLVVEVADGLLQDETAALLSMPEFHRTVTAVWYCAGDSGSALFGLEWLKQRGYVVEAVSGVVSSNPLASQEVNKNSAVPVQTKSELVRPGAGHQLMEKYLSQSQRVEQLASV